MVKCPKCKSDDYETLYIEDTSYEGNEMVVLIKARCANCDNKYWVREFFNYSHADNVL